MVDYEGDPAKQPPECKPVFTPSAHDPHKGSWSQCPNIKSGYSNWELERYSCDVCGKRYTLYDDEMR